MITQEKQLYKGYFEIELFDVLTKNCVYRTKILENTLTEVNRQYRQAMLNGTATSQGFTIEDLTIRYFAVGDGSTLATVNDTQLENERFRKLLTSVTTSGIDVSSTTVFLSNEANFRIREIGIFCGNNATGTTNSGIMISRINVDFTKNDNVAMNINRIDRTVI